MAVVGSFLAFVVTTVFMFSLRPLAVDVGLVDVPGGRKRHDGPVPLIGGIAMSIGLGFASSLVHHSDSRDALVMAMYLLVAVGSIDDRFDLPANSRLIAQACAALLVTFGSNVMVADLGQPLFFHASLGFLAAPFTLLFIITIINAYNVIDGLDGLAGGLAFIALSALAVVGYGTHVFTLAVLLAAAVAAFLVFNLPLGFNRAVRAFMGDAGSTSLGFGIACIGIQLCQGDAPAMSPVVGLWFVAVPVFDLFAVVIRRVAEGRSPFAPDHQHLHHALVMNGLSPRWTLAAMLTMGLACVGAGIGGHALGLPDGVLLIAWLVAGVLYYQAIRRPKVLAALLLRIQARWYLLSISRLGES